jgi:hypothetical protein
MLINGRKFDIRVFGLATSNHGTIRGYICSEGYIRTSSSQFQSNNFDDQFAHLTNDAIQKSGAEYGRYEAANKLTYG